jgi:hypothetical protein
MKNHLLKGVYLGRASITSGFNVVAPRRDFQN